MKIRVVEHNKIWAEKFEEEAIKIKKILGDNLAEIYHIGSTSVSGLLAKPIIDIMPVVYDIEAIDIHNTEFTELGYEPMGEYGIIGRRFFRKGGDDRTHHIHIFQIDNDYDISRHLAVRDYLRTHSKEAVVYGELKKKLALKFPEDNEGYCDGKDSYVKSLERKALEWYNKNKN